MATPLAAAVAAGAHLSPLVEGAVGVGHRRAAAAAAAAAVHRPAAAAAAVGEEVGAEGVGQGVQAAAACRAPRVREGTRTAILRTPPLSPRRLPGTLPH